MANHSSATERAQSPHLTNRPISVELRRRAQSIINNKSIDAGTRAIIRYGLEINDPWLPQLVRRTEAGEVIIDNLNPRTTESSQDYSDATDSLAEYSVERDSHKDDSNEAKLHALMELICRAGDEPEIKSGALLVLMATLENSSHPQALANMAKHLAFNRCCELNLYGMLDAQIAAVEHELLAGNIRYPFHFPKPNHHHDRRI